MRWTPIITLLVAAATPAAGSAVPAAPSAAADPDPRESPRAIRAVEVHEPIRIDGRLDDAGWERAVVVSEFTQIEPAEGSPVSERTEARILYDDEALYVGVRLWDSAPVSRRLGRRDMAIDGDSDWFGVMLDSDRDRRTAFGFDVNPDGVKRDLIKTINRDDSSWDAVWQVATQVDEEGWTAEYRIPFSQLRFRDSDDQTWGIQLERLIARTGEYATSTFIPRDDRGGVPAYGPLVGLRGIQTGKRLEARPYASVRAGSPASGTGTRPAAGLDLRYRVTSALTLNATLNPDFGQVELDPAVVNLSAFETFYDEKRPFFVEGAGVFGFGREAVGPGHGLGGLFYSRRIGRAPQLNVVGDVADATTILGAAKLTGQTESGWSLGVIEAATQAEWATPTAPSGPAEPGGLAEPMTNYFAARAERRMREGRSSLGGLVTAVHRRLETDAAADAVASEAYAGGIDFRHETSDRAWSVSGFAAGSHVLGQRGAIGRLQQAPARYYQRPDADYLSVDPNATSLSGWAGQLQVMKQAGQWRGDVGVFAATPGYEINDVGFLNRGDTRGVNGSITYLHNEPGTYVRSYRILGQFIHGRNFGGDVLDNIGAAAGMWQFQNFWSARVVVNHMLETLDDRAARGGPAIIDAATNAFEATVSTDPRQPVMGSVTTQLVDDADGGGARTLRLGATIRPAPWWRLEVGPRVSRSRKAANHIATVPDDDATSTYGHRYVFAELDQTTVSLDTRLDVTFSPSLTLELFARPFLSSVSFGDPMELAAPRTGEFEPYSGPVAVPDPDFSLRSLRGNAVARWEWQPGSTLYVAWQQQREDRAPGMTEFQLDRDADALFRTRPENVLMIKVDYWLNL